MISWKRLRLTAPTPIEAVERDRVAATASMRMVAVEAVQESANSRYGWSLASSCSLLRARRLRYWRRRTAKRRYGRLAEAPALTVARSSACLTDGRGRSFVWTAPSRHRDFRVIPVRRNCRCGSDRYEFRRARGPWEMNVQMGRAPDDPADRLRVPAGQSDLQIDRTCRGSRHPCGGTARVAVAEAPAFAVLRLVPRRRSTRFRKD